MKKQFEKTTQPNQSEGKELEMDFLFHDLIPDEESKQAVRDLTEQGWILKETCATDDPNSSEIHKELEKGYPADAVKHLQMNATRDGEPVGFNLYFVKKPSFSGPDSKLSNSPWPEPWRNM